MNDLNFPRGTICVERSVSGALTDLTYGRRKGELYAFGAGVGVGKKVKWLAIENPKHFREWLGCFSIL